MFLLITYSIDHLARKTDLKQRLFNTQMSADSALHDAAFVNAAGTDNPIFVPQTVSDGNETINIATIVRSDGTLWRGIVRELKAED